MTGVLKKCSFSVSTYVKEKYGLNTAMVSGSVEGRTTCPKLKNDLNTVLTCFSPISKDKKLLMPNDNTEIDFLIATDCISEGQNLQDCDYLINYDIHWNPDVYNLINIYCLIRKTNIIPQKTFSHKFFVLKFWENKFF